MMQSNQIETFQRFVGMPTLLLKNELFVFHRYIKPFSGRSVC